MASAAAASSVTGAGLAAALAVRSDLRPQAAVVAAASVAGGLGGFLLWHALPGRGEPLARAVQLIDKVHAKQQSPQQEAGLSELEYCLEVEKWVSRLCGGLEFASEALQLAARAQHFERRAIPRSSFPDGRKGYLAWRIAVKRRQQERLVALLRFTGVERAVVKRAGMLVGKDLPMEDPEMQVIEDATCLAFLAHELDTFQKNKDDAKMVDILQKTWKKMSRPAHRLAIGLDYSPRNLGCVVEAIAIAEGLEATKEPMAAPRLPSAAVALLRKSWAYVRQDTFGKDFLEKLYDECTALREVFAHSVSRPSNVTKAIQALLDQVDLEAVPRLERMVHAIAILSSKFGALRMAHMAPIKRALVRTVVAAAPAKEKSTTSRTWQAFFYCIAAVAAPVLVMGSNTIELAEATAAPLPTPGGGPQAAAASMHGAALLEMTLSITALAQGDAASEEIVAQLRRARGLLTGLVRQDVNAYCGLLSSIYGRGLGGKEQEDEGASLVEAAEYERWLRRATEVPLRIAEVASGLATACLPCKKTIKHSVKGDWITGVKLLRMAVDISLENTQINLKESGRAIPDIDARLLRLQETKPSWEDMCDV